MMYAQSGYLTNIFGNTNYYDLGKPVDNTKLRDVINYYHLCQYRSDYDATEKVYKSGFWGHNTDLSGFLSALVNEAKISKQEKMPFLFNYYHDDTGHTVLVCGYTYNSEKQQHEVTIYDCNSTSRFCTMRIARDYSSFEYEDGNGVKLHERWKNMDFCSINSLKNANYARISSGNTKSVQSSQQRENSAASSKVELTISAYTPFSLKNANGETLSYDGEKFGGTMTVYNTKNIRDTDAKMVLTIDASDIFTVTNFANGFEISAEIDNAFYMASAVGADSIILSKANGVVLDGDSYEFTTAMSCDLDSCELVKISGSTNGKISMSTTDDEVILNTENNSDNITVTTYLDTEYEEHEVDEETSSIIITDKSDGSVDIDSTDPTPTPSKPSTPSTPSKPSTPSTPSKSVSDIFSDIPATEWYVDAVQYVYDNGIMQGTGDGKFSPNATLTRAELAQILYNKAGKPEVSGLSTFSDVPATAWYAKAVAWAQQNNVVSGIGGNQFAPSQAITRESIAVMLHNDAGKTAVTGTLNFKDAAGVSDWAKDAMLWATQNKVINGAVQSDGTLLLNAANGAIRAETAAMLKNYYSK